MRAMNILGGVLLTTLLPFFVLARLIRNMWVLNAQAFRWTKYEAGEMWGLVADLFAGRGCK